MSWKKTRVAPEGTHHMMDDQPLYAPRFLDVLKYHAPGLAPVMDASGAYHIQLDGTPAYEDRFQRTFGFYHGLAAVYESKGWFHIHPDGGHAYPERYAWCGNYQDGVCTVRTFSGLYFHIQKMGQPLYSKAWHYAGDFRDGIATVQRADGLHTHIDKSGALLHGRWFHDLDVFHKGYARARDDKGWMHINAAGMPLYSRRFQGVEPFYNGQARVECFDSALEVIDEAGHTRCQPRLPRCSEFEALSADMVGFWKTQTMAAAVALGIFDRVPATMLDLRHACGLTARGASRLVNALRALGLISVDAQGRCTATQKGSFLKRTHVQTLADAALEYAGPMGQRWLSLPQALQQEGWQPSDIFESVAAEGGRVESHHRMLQSYARHDYPGLAELLDIGDRSQVIDAGGGLGVMAAEVARAWPHVQVLILERPEVVSQIQIPPAFNGRIRTKGCDLRSDWGERADVIIMARVLHDWPDAGAHQLLCRARAALNPGGLLYVIEMVLDETEPEGALCDLHLLVVTGGQERRRTEFEVLLNGAGFALEHVTPTSRVVSILKAVAR